MSTISDSLLASLVDPLIRRRPHSAVAVGLLYQGASQFYGFGRLSREQVLGPAIRLAEEGFPVNQVMAEFILSSQEKIARFQASQHLLMPGGEPLAPGDRYRS